MLKTISLKKKLIAYFLIVGLLPALIISLLAYRAATANIRGEILSELEIYAARVDSEMQKYFSEKECDINILAITGDIYESLNLLEAENWDTESPVWQERVKILEQFTGSMREEYGYADIFITNPRSEVVFSLREEMLGSDLSTRDYIKSSLEGEMTWAPLFYSDFLGENALILSAPVRSEGQQGKIVGTVNIFLDQKGIDQIVSDGIEELGESADVYLIDADGFLQTDTKLGDYTEGAALKEQIKTRAVEIYGGLYRSSTEEGNQVLHEQDEYVDYRGIPVLGQIRMTRLGSAPAGLILEIDVSEALQSVTALRNLMSIITVISFLIIIILAYSITFSITRPIQNVVEKLQEMAEKGGDLTQELKVNTQDELGEMGGSVNKMIGSVRELVARAAEISKGVEKSSDLLFSSVETSTQTLEQVASSTSELAAGTQELSNSSQEAAGLSQEVAASALHGADSIDQAVGQMQKVNEKIDFLSENIAGLGKRSEEVDAIINMITAVAEQTNLLALNAAIEAARAGEHGRGFALVAEEVRKLSEQSAESAEEISNLVKAIQVETRVAVENMKTTVEEVHSGSNLVMAGGKTFRKIVQNVEQINSKIEDISAAAQQLSAGSEEIAASTEEQSSIMEGINETADKLRAAAQELTANLERFKYN